MRVRRPDVRIGDFLSNSEEDVLRISKGHFIYLFSDKNCVNKKKNSVKMYGDIEIYNNFLTYRLGEKAVWRPTHFSYYQVFSCIFH